MKEQKVKEFKKALDELAESYPEKFLGGTRQGLALMKLLGFKRSDFSVKTPAGKKGGWDKTRICIGDYNNERLLYKKALDNKELFLGAGFDVTVHYFERKMVAVNIVESYEKTATYEEAWWKKGNKLEIKNKIEITTWFYEEEAK